MILVADDVGSKELAAHLPVGSFQLTNMDSGDAAFLNYELLPIGIERKAVYDLFECFKTGRLNTQIQRMSEAYKEIYLIVEGRFRVNKETQKILVPRNGEWAESRISYSAIDNYLNTLVDEYHIKLKYSHSLQETAWQIFNLFTHHQEEKHSSHLKLDTTWQVNPFMPASFEKRVAAQLDHIGNEKADLIVSTFKSVQNMANATEEQWKQIKGIGPTIAKSVVQQFQKS